MILIAKSQVTYTHTRARTHTLSENQRRARLITIGERERRRATIDKSEVAQRAKGRKLSNKNNGLPTNTSTFEAAIHSIKMTRL